MWKGRTRSFGRQQEEIRRAKEKRREIALAEFPIATILGDEFTDVIKKHLQRQLYLKVSLLLERVPPKKPAGQKICCVFCGMITNVFPLYFRWNELTWCNQCKQPLCLECRKKTGSQCPFCRNVGWNKGEKVPLGDGYNPSLEEVISWFDKRCPFNHEQEMIEDWSFDHAFDIECECGMRGTLSESEFA